MKKSNSHKILKAAMAATVATGAIVVAAPTFTEAAAPTFKDVNNVPGDYFYAGVTDLAERGVINGYPDGTFKPYNNMSRQHAAKVMALALGLDLKNVKDPGFSDVPKSNPYYTHIAALVEAGIINGYDNGTFAPKNNLTRSQMAKIIVLGFEFEEAEKGNLPFTDVKAGEWHEVYIQTLYANEITTGTTATTFSPYKQVTRGQMAAFINRSEAVESADLASVKETAKLVVNGSVPIAFGDYATAEDKLVAVQTYVNELIKDKEVKAKVEAGTTAGEYAVTLTKADAKVVKTIAIAFAFTAKDLLVSQVDLIGANGIDVTFKATLADNAAANVVVTNSTGKVVPTKATLVAEGSTSATIAFVTPVTAADLVGVWTVNGVEYNFTAIKQLASIIAAANATPFNELNLIGALNTAGIKNVDANKALAYAGAIKADKAVVATLADIQVLVNAVNENALTAAEKAAAVKAVTEAKNQVQLAAALTKFERVNNDWIVAYSGKLLNKTFTFEQIQTEINTVNNAAIAVAHAAASTTVEQAAVTALIGSWMKADDAKTPTITPKADLIAASKVKESAFTIAESTTANNLYNALVAHANLVANDKDATVLKLTDLNVNNKAAYWSSLDEATEKAALVVAIKAGTADFKKHVVDANAATDSATLVTVLENLNKVEETTTEADVLALLQSKALNLKNAVKPEYAKAYKAALVADKTTLTATAVNTLVGVANDAQDAAAGLVSTEAELKAALGNATLTTITLENNIIITSNVVLTKNITLNGNGNTLYINTVGTGATTAEGLAIPANSENVVVENIVITTATHGDNLIEISGDATLKNVTAIGGKKAGIYVNKADAGTITVNLQNITTAGNGWKAGIGLVAHTTDSKVVANFSGTHSFGEETAVYTDDFKKYIGKYDVNGLVGFTKTLVGDQYKWTKTK